MSTSDTKTSNVNSALAHLADVVDQRRDAFKTGNADLKNILYRLTFF